MAKLAKKEIEIIQNTAIVQQGMTCCVCSTEGRRIQVHHIDGNNSNNELDNLAIVCTICHGNTLLKGDFNRKLTPALVRMFRDDHLKRIDFKRNFGLSVITNTNDKSENTDNNDKLDNADNNEEDTDLGWLDYVHYAKEAMAEIPPIAELIVTSANQFAEKFIEYTPKILNASSSKNESLMRLVMSNLGKELQKITPDFEKSIADFIEKCDTAFNSQLKFIQMTVVNEYVVSLTLEEDKISYIHASSECKESFIFLTNANNKVIEIVSGFIGVEQQSTKALSKLKTTMKDYDIALQKYINILDEIIGLMNV